MITAYPLTWPAGQPRTPIHKRTRNYAFKTTQDKAMKNVLAEIRRLGGGAEIISTNIPTRKDGLPYADASRYRIEDRGIAVYFDLGGNQMCFACDKWDNFADNMHAIAKTIEALRGIERWGSGEMMRQAFTGFQALPSPSSVKRHWTEVLGIPFISTIETIEIVYKQMVKKYHEEGRDLTDLNVARDEAKAERKP